MHHGLTALGVEMQQHLGVGVGAKHAPLGFELAAQFAVVVDFAVERDAQPAISAEHRLGAGIGKVDDGQAPVRQADALVIRDPQAGAVRPAFEHGLADTQQFFAVYRGCRIAIAVDAGDAAHGG